MRQQNKVLLMGRSNSGKTSMRSILFASFLASDTFSLGPTRGFEQQKLRILGSLVLSLLDCGGQDSFMNSYFVSQRETIFKGASVLIYVFDVESDQPQLELDYFKMCLESMQEASKDAQLFCLIHKMDLIRNEQDKKAVFEQKQAVIRELAQSHGFFKVQCFATSIWDETLYEAWSNMVHSLIPNMNLLTNKLKGLCNLLCADEVVLFEHATFLVIASYGRKQIQGAHRFEQISNIIKQFKLTCNKLQSSLVSMQIKSNNVIAFIQRFTSTSVIMVIMSDPRIKPAATMMNIDIAAPHFEQFIRKQFN